MNYRFGSRAKLTRRKRIDASFQPRSASLFFPPPYTSLLSPRNQRTATRNFPGFTPVAETAVERNFRSRKKPRANTTIKRAPRKNPRLPSPSLSFFDPPHEKRICTSDRPVARSQGERQTQNENEKEGRGVREERTGAILSRWENEIARDYAAAAAVTLRHEKEEL